MRLGRQMGIVISERSLRLCVVRRTLFRDRVIGTALYDLNPDDFDDWPGRIEAAAEILKNHLRENKLPRIPINIGLVSEDIAFRRIYLPPMPAGEQSAAVMWEGEKIFPFSLSECRVYHKRVGWIKRGEADTVAINMVAARQSMIETIYDRFGAAGLRIGQIGYLPTFMADGLSAHKTVDGEKHTLYLYLDDTQGMALFVHRGALEFFQQFVTKPLPDSENDRALVNQEAIASELNSFLELYKGQSAGIDVDGIKICGKYAADSRAAAYIANQTGLPCRTTATVTGMASLPSDPGENKIADYLDAVATALADPGENPLAPVAIREPDQRRKMTARVGAAAAMALLIVAGMHFQLHHREKNGLSHLKYKKVVVEAFEKSPGYLAYVNLMAKLERDRTGLNRARPYGQSHFNVLLKELTLLLPEHISLTSIDLDEREGKFLLQIDGHVRLADFSPEIVLAEYVETLGASPFFQNVAVLRHDKKRDGDHFDLIFQLKMDARV